MKAVYSFEPDLAPLLREHLALNLKLWANKRVLRSTISGLVATVPGQYGLVAFDNFVPAKSLEHEGVYDGRTADDAIQKAAVGREFFPDILMAKLIVDFLQGDHRAIAIFDHRLKGSEPHTPWCEADSFMIGNEIYQFVPSQHPRVELVEDGLRSGGDRWMVGVCTKAPVDVIKPGNVVEDLEGILRGAEHVFTEALDGMGYVTWSRNDVDRLGLERDAEVDSARNNR